LIHYDSAREPLREVLAGAASPVSATGVATFNPCIRLEPPESPSSRSPTISAMLNAGSYLAFASGIALASEFASS
jgi:hypothetical protein